MQRPLHKCCKPTDILLAYLANGTSGMKPSTSRIDVALTRFLSTEVEESDRSSPAPVATHRATSISTQPYFTTARSKRPRAIAQTSITSKRRSGSTRNARAINHSSLTSLLTLHTRPTSHDQTTRPFTRVRIYLRKSRAFLGCYTTLIRMWEKLSRSLTSGELRRTRSLSS